MAEPPADPGFEHEVDVRFRDFDALGHVNHAAYASYCEQARLRYLERAVGVSVPELREGVDGRSLALASLELDYRRPVTEAGRVTVALGVTDLGDSSVEMAYELRAAGEVVATARTVLVAVDADTGGSAPLPAAWREGLA